MQTTAKRDEVAEWEKIAAEMALYRHLSLSLIRRNMARLWQIRAMTDADAVVTPDDAREYFEGMDPPPPPASELSRNFLAVVFRTKEWEPVGRYRSQVSGSHGNELRTYRWRGGAR